MSQLVEVIRISFKVSLIHELGVGQFMCETQVIQASHCVFSYSHFVKCTCRPTSVQQLLGWPTIVSTAYNFYSPTPTSRKVSLSMGRYEPYLIESSLSIGLDVFCECDNSSTQNQLDCFWRLITIGPHKCYPHAQPVLPQDKLSRIHGRSQLEFNVPFQHKQAYSYIRDKRSGVESYAYPVKEGKRYINLNPDRLFVQQSPKKGKGSRGSFKLLRQRLHQQKTTIAPQD